MIASLESDPPTANDIQERDEKQKHIIEAIRQNPIFFTKALESVNEYIKVMSENNCAPLSYYSVEDKKIMLDRLDRDKYLLKDGRFIPVFQQNNFLPNFFSQWTFDEDEELSGDERFSHEIYKNLSTQKFTLKGEVEKNDKTYLETWETFKQLYPDEVNKLRDLFTEQEDRTEPILSKPRRTYEDYILIQTAVLDRETVPTRAFALLRSMGIDRHSLVG